MNDSMLGLDPEQCRAFAKLLKSSSQKINSTTTQLAWAVGGAGWQGPDSNRFRQQWPNQRQQLLHAARGLEDAAESLLKNVVEQERASAVASSGGGGSPWSKLVNGAKGLWDDLTDGAGKLLDGAGNLLSSGWNSLKDGMSWVGNTLSKLPVVENTIGFLKNTGGLLKMGWDILHGNPPTISALVAQSILTVGDALNVVGSAGTFGIWDPNIFEDGKPYAGDPIAVEINADNRQDLMPSSASNIFNGVADAYAVKGDAGAENGVVRIVTVKQADGTNAYIVNIPGTEDWSVGGSGNARDLTSNLKLVAGQSSTASESVILAMQKANIPPGAPVMLSGHSQGGIIAADLVSDSDFMSKYNVTNMLTAGSPIDGTNVPYTVKTLAVQHATDVVPMLDLGGDRVGGDLSYSPDNISVVTMDNPTFKPDPNKNNFENLFGFVGNNHDFDLYVKDLAKTDQYPQIGTYENDPSMTPFITDDSSRVTIFDVPVGRK